jgi:hypothetical protein
MLYSIGKDSRGDAAPGRKAFYPAAALPAAARRHDLEVPDMYELRDRMARERGWS